MRESNRASNLLLTACLTLAPSMAAAQSAESVFFRADPDITKYAVIITGPTVGEDNEIKFRRWTASLYDILLRDYGYTADTVTLLFDRGRRSHPAETRLDGAATAADIRAAFSRLEGRVKAGDQLTLFLMGHGSDNARFSRLAADSRPGSPEAKFNIAGPDLTGIQFAALLDRFQTQDVVVVNTTSASYGFAAALSGEGRVIISATRSPSERYDPIFPRFFIEALDGRAGDLDRNQRVSMLEAFNYAKAGVMRWYEEQGRLASEHAGLDDNGDALFSLNPAAGEPDGRFAEIAYIDNLIDDGDRLSVSALALKARMQELEREVFILRGRKNEFLSADYWRRMETLLVELAQTTRRFDAQL